MFMENSLADYLEKLSSQDPVPGGGSASALTGAMGCALLGMVARYSAGKGAEPQKESEARTIIKKADALRAELQRLCQEDAVVYGALSEKFRLPKSTDQEKARRSGEIQQMLKAAAEVPLRTAEAVHQGMQLAGVLIGTANPNLISDVGVAVFFLRAAMQGAVLNIEVNLKSIKDVQFVEQTRKACAPWVRSCEDISMSITERVTSAVIK